jgi:AcrR family transcriptional regulator
MNSVDKRYIRGEATYRQIIEAATDIISEQGVSGLTASKLSERSKISKSSVFHHFSSTQEIPFAVLKAIMENMIQPFEKAEKKVTLEAYLLDLGKALCYMIEEQRRVYKVFFAFYHESIYNEVLKNMLSEFLESTKDDLKHIFLDSWMVKASNFISEMSREEREKEAEKLSYLLITTLDGMGLHLLMGEPADTYMHSWQLQINLLRRYFI